MAGWHKHIHGLHWTVQISRIAESLGSSQNEAVGAVHAMWEWFCEQSMDGKAKVAESKDRARVVMDRFTKTPGLTEAMEGIGWIRLDETGGVEILQAKHLTFTKAVREAERIRKAQQRARARRREEGTDNG